MRKFFLVAMLLTASLAVSLGQTPEVSRYEEAAGWDLPLYRGKLMPEYPFRFNGTYFWDNNGFRKGRVCFGGKIYDDINLNIDAARQAVYTRFQNRIQVWELDRDLVEWLEIEGTKFVNLRAMGVKKAPEGFFEVLRDGEEMALRQITKVYRESIEINGYYLIGYSDPNYNDKIFAFYEQKEVFYFLNKKGGLEKFRSIKKLAKKHPDTQHK